jgi:rhamnose transport system substrate-binding protein
MKKALLAFGVLAILALPIPGFAQATATPGKALKMVLITKWLANDKIGVLYNQVRKGAEEAAAELKNPAPLQFLGPLAGKSIPGQSEIVTKVTAEGVDAIMITNNSGEQIVPAIKAAHDKGIKVVSWDSPIHSAEGEDLLVAQVDFADAGKVLAQMAHDILGPAGGKFAILSTNPTAPGPNAWIKAFQDALKDPKFAGIEQVDIAYGNGQAQASYQQALALVDKHPDLGLIMAPNTVGIVAAAQALQDRKLCDKVKVTGFGLPFEMPVHVLNGCAPEFALWNFTDLGYLTYYTTYLLATDAIKAEAGQQFNAGRMGTYTITKDPNRPTGLRVLMGPFTIYDKTNIEAAAQ